MREEFCFWNWWGCQWLCGRVGCADTSLLASSHPLVPLGHWAALSQQSIRFWFDLQANAAFSAVRAGLVSAEVLQREQQELRSQESSTRLLAGRVESLPEQQQLSLLSEALSGVRAQLQNVPAEQQPDLLVLPCARSLSLKYDILKGHFKAMLVKSWGGREAFSPSAPAASRIRKGLLGRAGWGQQLKREL